MKDREMIRFCAALGALAKAQKQKVDDGWIWLIIKTPAKRIRRGDPIVSKGKDYRVDTARLGGYGMTLIIAEPV